MLAAQIDTAMTLGEFIAEYQRDYRQAQPSTIAMMETIWRVHLLPAVGDKPVAEFTSRDAQRFVSRLAQKGLSRSSIRSYVKMIKSAMNWAAAMYYRQGDPFAGVRIGKVPTSPIRIYSQAEVQAMLAAAKSHRERGAIIAAVSAGLRLGEVGNLRWCDVDLEARLIQVQARSESDTCWKWQPKDYECRTVPMVKSLEEVLVQMLLELKTHQPYIFLTPKQYLRHQSRRDTMSYNLKASPLQSRKWWNIIKRKSGVSGTFHDLRKTCITHWLREGSGLSVKEVMKLAGHAEVDTTMRYYAAARPDVALLAAQTNPIV